jgi:alcohol dehydrogenase class IV
MENSKYYICQYCYNEFEPKRRRVQKYCSNSCRSKAYYLRQQQTTTNIEKLKPLQTATAQNKISLAGIGNAALGTLAASAAKNYFTNDENKPVTKKDFYDLLAKINSRYLSVKNMHPNILGQQPYYDIIDQTVVYF